MKPHITFDAQERLVTLHTEQADITVSFTVFRQMFDNGGADALTAVGRLDPAGVLAASQGLDAKLTLLQAYGWPLNGDEEHYILEVKRESCPWARQTGERNAYLHGWRDRAALQAGTLVIEEKHETPACRESMAKLKLVRPKRQ